MVILVEAKNQKDPTGCSRLTGRKASGEKVLTRRIGPSLCFAVVLAAALSAGSLCYGASTLSLSSPGDGSFLLQGRGLEGVGALDITVSYDESVLANPRVVAEALLSGAMTAINTKGPGSIRIAAIRTTPIRGSGVLFTLAFTQKKNGRGVRSVTARLFDRNGTPLVSRVQMDIEQGNAE